MAGNLHYKLSITFCEKWWVGSRATLEVRGGTKRGLRNLMKKLSQVGWLG